MRYYKSTISTLMLLLVSIAMDAMAASIPLMIPYSGTVAVIEEDEAGPLINGDGQFKFAIINKENCKIGESDCILYWSNDNELIDSANGKEPKDHVILPSTVQDVVSKGIPVSKGAFSIKLGDTTLTNMQALPENLFDNPTTYLRIWFNDGVKGFQQLSPDRQLVSVPYAFRADVADKYTGTIGSSQITAGAVGATQINKAQVQSRVSQTCSPGLSIREIKEDGTVTCETDDTGGTASDVVCPGCVDTTDIANSTVSIEDLAFDPASQAELDITKTELSIPGTINSPTNPSDWTKLKNVPAGFADGTDNIGPGDGHSLDAADGDPVDVVFVDNAGNVGIGTSSPKASLHVKGTLTEDEKTSQNSTVSSIGESGSNFYAQSFIANNKTITAFGVWLKEYFAEGQVILAIVNDNAGNPDVASVLYSGSLVNPSTAGRWFYESGLNITVTPGAIYWVLIDGYKNIGATGYSAAGTSTAYTDTGDAMKYSNDGGVSWSTYSSPLSIYVATGTPALLGVEGRIMINCSICMGWADVNGASPTNEQCFDLNNSGRDNNNFLQLGGTVNADDRLWLWMQCP
ncbi:MAG TPA: hypothetical protein DDX84_03505 [Nitrospiraceae bacterium]|nr:hypothetical protein [Nitrospiraceae bacterium]